MRHTTLNFANPSACQVQRNESKPNYLVYEQLLNALGHKLRAAGRTFFCNSQHHRGYFFYYYSRWPAVRSLHTQTGVIKLNCPQPRALQVLVIIIAPYVPLAFFYCYYIIIIISGGALKLKRVVERWTLAVACAGGRASVVPLEEPTLEKMIKNFRHWTFWLAPQKARLIVWTLVALGWVWARIE